jgi:hypothetical protein
MFEKRVMDVAGKKKRIWLRPSCGDMWEEFSGTLFDGGSLCKPGHKITEGRLLKHMMDSLWNLLLTDPEFFKVGMATLAIQ